MASQNFSYTGSVQTWTVPAGVFSVTVDMAGARGGRGGNQGSTTGLGGRVQATLPVTPGHTLYIYVGGAGTDLSSGVNPAGGFGDGNGGSGGKGQSGSPSFGGAGGGGASGVRDNADTTAARMLVAGAGGGLATNGQVNGGDGGGTTASAGQNGGGATTQTGGGPGTPSAVGAGGTTVVGDNGSAGSSNVGGNAGTGSTGMGTSGAGGGGGGYFGGGGGASQTIGSSAQASGGGGGSSYADPSATSVTHTPGYQDGNGYVNLTYALAVTFTESISITDTIKKQATRILTQAITITDTIKKVAGRLFSESNPITDAFTGLRVKIAAFLESNPVSDGDNVVINGNFELAPPFTAAQTTASKWIDGTAAGSSTRQPYAMWASFGGAAGDRNAQFDPSNICPDGGLNSMKVHINSGAYCEVKGNAVNYTVADGFRLKQNTKYNWSAWAKSENVTGSASGGQTIALLFADIAGAAANLTLPSVVSSISLIGSILANKVWTKYSGSFTTGPTVAWFHPEFRAYGHNGAATLAGDFWFDEFYVYEDSLSSVNILVGRVLAEVSTIVDTVNRVVGRAYSEAMTILDTLLKLPGKNLSETITVLDDNRNLGFYRFKITAQSAKVTNANEQIYYRLANAPAEFWNYVKSDGSDIRVTRADGITQVAREVSFIDTSGQDGAVFFDGTSLNVGSNTDFYIYYGNNSNVEPAAGSVYGKNAVWSAYEAAWHFEGNGNDSSANAKNLTNTGMGFGSEKIGKGAFQQTNGDDLRVSGFTDPTIPRTTTVWLKTSMDTAGRQVWRYRIASSGNEAYRLFIEQNTGFPFVWFVDSGGTGFLMLKPSVNVADGALHLLTTFYRSDQKVDMLVDGVLYSGTLAKVPRASDQLLICDSSLGAGGGIQIDEFLVIPQQQSSNWGVTLFNNQSDPASFWVTAANESVASTYFLITVGKLLVEVATITDAIIYTIGRAFSETITIVATLIKMASKTLTQTITVVSTLLKKGGRTLSQTVTITDTLIKIGGHILSDSFTIIDTFAKVQVYGRILTETIMIRDRIKVFLNGLNPFWKDKILNRVTGWIDKFSRRNNFWDDKF